MNLKNKLRILIIFIILTIIILYIANRDGFNLSLACDKHEDFKQEIYNGEIIKKYIDQSNHRAKTITIKNKENLNEIILLRDTSGFYEFVKAGDSILKSKNSDVIEVINVDSIRKFKIWFGCKK